VIKEPSVCIQLAGKKRSLAAALGKVPLRSHSSRHQPAPGKVIMGTSRGLLTAAGQSNPGQSPVINWPGSTKQRIRATPTAKPVISGPPRQERAAQRRLLADAWPTIALSYRISRLSRKFLLKQPCQPLTEAEITPLAPHNQHFEVVLVLATEGRRERYGRDILTLLADATRLAPGSAVTREWVDG
jgi:hypothetical protein